MINLTMLITFQKLLLWCIIKVIYCTKTAVCPIYLNSCNSYILKKDVFYYLLWIWQCELYSLNCGDFPLSIIAIGQQQAVLPRESIHKQAPESDHGRLSLISNNSAIICPIQSKSRVKASPLWIAKGPAWGQRVAFWWVSGSKTSTIGRTGLHNSEG